MTIVTFAGILARQMMEYGKVLEVLERNGQDVTEDHTERDAALRAINLEVSELSSIHKNTASSGESDSNVDTSIESDDLHADTSVAFASAGVSNDHDQSDHDPSVATTSSGEDDANINIGVIIQKYHDLEGCKHWVAQYGKTVSQTSGKKYTKARKCVTCGKHTCCFWCSNVF